MIDVEIFVHSQVRRFLTFTGVRILSLSSVQIFQVSAPPKVFLLGSGLEAGKATRCSRPVPCADNHPQSVMFPHGWDGLLQVAVVPSFSPNSK